VLSHFHTQIECATTNSAHPNFIQTQNIAQQLNSNSISPRSPLATSAIINHFDLPKKSGTAGHKFGPPIIQHEQPRMRGPMLAGKALDQYTATDKYMKLAPRSDRITPRRQPSVTAQTSKNHLKLRV